MNPENQNGPTTNPESVEAQTVQPPRPTVEPTYFSTNTTPANVIPVAKKSNKKMLILIAIAIVVLLLVGAGAYFLLKSKATTASTNSNTNSSSSTNKTGSAKKLTAKEAVAQIYTGKWYGFVLGTTQRSWIEFTGTPGLGTETEHTVVSIQPQSSSYSITSGVTAEIAIGSAKDRLSQIEPIYYDTSLLVVKFDSADVSGETFYGRDATAVDAFARSYFGDALIAEQTNLLDGFYTIKALDPANNLLP